MVISRVPTVAVVDDGETTIVPLLEAQLTTTKSATWVERGQIELILKEQRLQAAFSADAVQQRSRLGQLLKCDLLVLFRTTNGLPGEAQPTDGTRPPQIIECTIAETKHGLRLLTAYVPKNRPAEVNVRDLTDVVERGIQKWQQKIVQIFAVSPLVSDDLDYRRNYLQSAYARLIQQQLLDIPGTVVVELAEAQAIARELALAGEEAKIDRNLFPFYIHGRYRHDDVAAPPTVKFNLRLEQGDKVLRGGDSQPMDPAAASEWLQRATAALVKAAGRAEPRKSDPERESIQLAKRADDFVQIGNWEEALALVEASLLLDPTDADNRKLAIVCCGRVRSHYFDKRVPLHELLPQLKQAMTAYRRGMEHLEIYLEKNDMPVAPTGGSSFVTDFESPFWATIRISHNAPEEAHELVRDVQSLRTENYLRLGFRRAEQKHVEKLWFGWLTFGLPLKDRLVIIRRMIDRVDAIPGLIDPTANELGSVVRDFGSKDASVPDRIRQLPELAALMEDLEKSTSPHRRTLATETRRQATQQISQQNSIVFERQPMPQMDLNADFKFAPITFHLSNNQPLKDVPISGFPAGECDIYFGRNTIYGMKRPGILRPLWEERSQLPNVGMGVFDGRYAWFVLDHFSKSPRVIVIDPKEETTFDFKAPIAFPAATPGSHAHVVMKLCPLSPGKVLIAGHMGRSWIGVAETRGGSTGEFKIVYEARGAELPERHEKQPADVAFLPDKFLPRELKDGGLEVLIIRGSTRAIGAHFASGLIYSAADDSVKPSDEKFDYTKSRGIASYANQIQYLEMDSARNPQRLEFYLVGMDDEEVSPRVLVSDIPWGKIFWHEDRLHIVGERWCVWNPRAQQFVELAGEIPWMVFGAPVRKKGRIGPIIRKPTPYDMQIESIFSSRHYGLVFTTNHRQMYSVTLPSLND